MPEVLEGRARYALWLKDGESTDAFVDIRLEGRLLRFELELQTGRGKASVALLLSAKEARQIARDLAAAAYAAEEG